MRRPIDRRSVLAALGLAGGSLFLPSLFDRGPVARADLPSPPKRIVFVLTSHGTVYPNWSMRPAGLSGPEVNDWEFPLTAPGLDFSRTLKPLAPFAQKMLVLDGLALWTAIAGTVGNEHDRGEITCLTGSLAKDVGDSVLTATAPSIDQVIAAKVARKDRIPSLELGDGYYRGYVYDDAGKALPSDGTPTSVFKRLFPGGGGPAVTDDDKIRAGQGSVLDLARSQYAALGARLGQEDRKKLQQHADLIADLESRIAGLASAKCAAPPSPADPDPNAESGAYKAMWDGLSPLVAAALSCDLTRVVTISVGGPNNADIMAPPGDIHQLYAHHAEDPQNPDAAEYMTRFHTYDATMVANLAAALDAVPEGNGTVLDNTMIVWCGELATGSHQLHRWPAVLLGGLGGAFKMGRYVHYAQKVPLTGSGGHDDKYYLGAPHNQLLVSLANAMGLSLSSAGETKVSLEGRSVDLTGGLERLS